MPIEKVYTQQEVLAIAEQSWWAGFNNSAEGNNGEHCTSPMSHYEDICKKEIPFIVDGKMADQRPNTPPYSVDKFGLLTPTDKQKASVILRTGTSEEKFKLMIDLGIIKNMEPTKENIEKANKIISGFLEIVL